MATKPARKIAKEYHGSWGEYSARLGRSRDYLSNYKHNHPHIKTPLQAYREVMDRQIEQEAVCSELDGLLTHLVSKRRLSAFQEHLHRIEPTRSRVSLKRVRVMVSVGRLNLLELQTLEYYKNLIKEINEWM